MNATTHAATARHTATAKLRAAMLCAAVATSGAATTASADQWQPSYAPQPMRSAAPHIPSPAQTSNMTVDVNRTHVLRLGQPASAVVVGNPSIADIAVHSTDTILVLGRNYGTTNILAFDAFGNVMAETTVTVGDAPSHARLRVFEGARSRKTYECGAECLPVPMVGDDPAFRTLNTNSTLGPLVDTVVSSAPTPAASDFAAQGFGPGATSPMGSGTSSMGGGMPQPAMSPPPSMAPQGMGGFGTAPTNRSRPIN